MDLDNFQYFALLALALLFTVPLEFIYGFKVWRAPKRLVKAVLPIAALFVIWDLVSINRGLWSFSPDYTTGWVLPGGIPLEEICFFLVVPAAGISGFEACRAGLRQIELKRSSRDR